MRKGKAKKRILNPDPKFNDVLVARFVNNLMISGNKNAAYKIFYGAIDKVADVTKEDGLEVWRRAVANITPAVEVKSRRVGGANYQIPQEVRPERKVALAMKWLTDYSRVRKEKSMVDKLAAEIISASKEEGSAYKKKEDTHRMAEANKAFAHFKF
ncbi:MAG TPA: 30S ribosomal protein S7 [Bacteroidia bacterium]|nr:30S ribosomal protein S7 [Bacteroidia bacterium]